MKHFILFCIILCLPRIAAAQDSINPYNLGQSCNIVIQNTDVYYAPMEPPAPYDTRAGLCALSSELFSPNGFGTLYPPYQPITHDSMLSALHPYGGAPLGYGVPWQRLFTAHRKADGTATTISTSGSVTISKNEDVDFRASGMIKLNSGFRTKPGCFFHAYTEPNYTTTVFSDEFDSTALDQTKWHVVNGDHDGYGNVQCSSPANVRDSADPDAHDGHALDIIMQENTSLFTSHHLISPDWNDNCMSVRDTAPDTTSTSLFSSAIIRACPWPFFSHDSLAVIYAHQPYGKYEVRMKIPHTLHHANNWLYGSYEVDMDEGDPHQNVPGLPPGHQLWPSLHRAHRYGPFKGMFHKLPDSTVIFVSSEADWSLVNQPMEVFIDKVPYCVVLDTGHNKDTVVARLTGAGLMAWPNYLKNSTDSISFLYSRYADWGTTPVNIADTLTWTADTDAYGNYNIIKTPYHVNRLGDTLWFTKAYQPTTITLKTKNVPPTFKTLNCYWDSTLNSSGDTGRILLNDTELAPTDLHSNTEAYTYTNDEGIFEYMGPPIPFDWSDSTPSSYEYHTFGVEIMPNVVRFLYDSNVVFRIPDRLIPPGNPQYDLAAQLERSPMDFRIGEFDIDGDNYNDVFGTNPNSVTYRERMSFEHAAANMPWAGFSMVGGKPTAHYLIDYVKVWDVPSDVKISPFPH